jgi:hypothetical protein
MMRSSGSLPPEFPKQLGSVVALPSVASLAKVDDTCNKLKLALIKLLKIGYTTLLGIKLGLMTIKNTTMATPHRLKIW